MAWLLVLLAAIAPLCPATTALSAESSAFLRAHAASPVAWLPWGEAAFTRAKQEQKPIFVSIGAATSELTRAMHRESFGNAEMAAFLNQHFVCVLVDAKERPDLAALGQSYLHAVKQLGGLPVNLWLTPELKPFEGANYLPPTDEWGKEGFTNTATRVAKGWEANPAGLRRKADDTLATIVAAEHHIAPEPIAPAAIATLLATNVESLRSHYDPAHGGFGDPPKYPEPELLRFLLHDKSTRELGLATLRAIVQGGLHDPLDGGFFRYAADAEWRQPYFQKTLTDQARLALALLEAARISGDVRFAEAARGALTYSLDRLSDVRQEFAAAEDATPPDLTAAYLWTAGEIETVLGDQAAAEFDQAYGVTPAGNLTADAFPGVATAGKNFLLRVTPRGTAAAEQSLARSAAKLLQRRLQRPTPWRDDAATSGAHGLMLTALVRAAALLNEPRFATAAAGQEAFIRDRLRATDGSLLRLAGRPDPASPQDYALVVQGLLAFHAQTGDAPAEALARDLVSTVDTRLWDGVSGRYFAVYDPKAPGIWARVHSPAPGPGEPPSAEAAMLLAITGDAAIEKSAGDLSAKLVRTLAAELKDAGDTPRGDLLLALQAAQKPN